MSHKQARKEEEEHADQDESRIQAAVDALQRIQQQIETIVEEQQDEERVIDRRFDERRAPLYVQRREQFAVIPNFWIVCISHSPVSFFISNDEDQEILSHLTDLEIVHLPEPRSVAIRLHFKDCPFFSNTLLEKKLIRHGEDYTAETTQIQWKAGKNVLDARAKAKEAHKKKSKKEGQGKHEREEELGEEEVDDGFLHWYTEASPSELSMQARFLSDLKKTELILDPFSLYNEDDEDDEKDGEDEDDEDDEPAGTD
ncbi:putative template-activating factor I [Paratrimastix pyriformis]|uniref:Template-activating factor I n=1 Tax=Paratrimastix pyriformis TaxID=342808 RepID=A0ABQ8U934_9EUKA|nr:putative template-activating factor I [Paratrimastix pyriformis]